MTQAAVIVAIGAKAEYEAQACQITALEHGADECFILKHNYGGVSDKQVSRYTKTRVLKSNSYEQVLYLDADTRVTGDLAPGWAILSDGWDMAITPSTNQGTELLWHIQNPERETTMLELGYSPLQLQAGVIFVSRNERTEAFFDAWLDEYLRWGDEDQAAFLRALNRVPLKVWLLGRPWNGGPVIQHRFGALRQ